MAAERCDATPVRNDAEHGAAGIGATSAAVRFEPSANRCFGVFDAGGAARPEYAGLKAVVIGGGTGAPVSIRALRALGAQVSAVVAMADDGGSTGVVCERTGALPPGDIRKCLAAFADDPGDPFVQAFTARLPFADDHALGNLLLAALEHTAGGFPEAVHACERLLGAEGSVHPCTLDRVRFCARTADGQTICGQKASCHSAAALYDAWLEPLCTGAPDAGALPTGAGTAAPKAYEGACAAIAAADLVVLGPGSLFTSVISNLAVPGIAAAVAESSARVVYVCPIADTQGETRGMDAADHAQALARHGLQDVLDVVLVNSRPIVQPPDRHVEAVRCDDEAVRRIEALGACVKQAELADSARPSWHNPTALCRALAAELDECLSR